MKKLLNSFAFVAAVYGSTIVLLSAFRVALFLFCKTPELLAGGDASLVFRAFAMGLRFDTLIVCAVLALPLAALLLSSFFSFSQRKIFIGAQIWCSVALVVVLFCSAANIPYFDNFKKTLNASVLNWVDEPAFVWGMVSRELSFTLSLVVFVAVCVGFCWWIFRLRKFFERRAEASAAVSRERKSLAAAAGICVVATAACVAGIRGSFAPQTLKMGHAYFCSVPFLNELGLNPTFVFVKTIQYSVAGKGEDVRLMDPAAAEKIVRQYLGTTDSGASPIRRSVPAKPVVKKKNVVLVMMESMSYDFFERKIYTPNLNALAEKSRTFPNAFSAGIHTVNGLYSLSFGFPALMAQQPFKTSGGFVKYSGLAEMLRERGYTTYFITSQDDQFDNAGGYLRANGIEKIISYNDYPAESILSKLGPSDDYAMRFSIPILTRDRAETGKPFFAYYMTTCNHAPRVIPDYFKPRSSDEVEQTVELTDYAVGVFLEQAKKEPWFNDTIFIFTGDHGMVHYGSKYEEALPSHHIPLIIYTPDDETKIVDESLAGQIDVPATVMGMLGFAYENDTFGIDLLSQRRPYIFYSSDYSVVALDHEYFYFRQLLSKKEFLYRWKDGGTENLAAAEPERAKKMREYSEAMIQTAQEEVNRRK